ncbi:site-specific DNA-methyltransferase [Sphingomonas sp. BT-65]|uniref:site-specific DNA-methyltransferase n=1 Tax=Sphingomonas sp. BT-65 TaxID=2989821 RepID=UPI002236ACBC|nr:site-specific DNA-methyltransferase [Sphingomonas sp. BT-65]MCW4463115.1 site-specific DNA-methyltransferase [Sphingomonas sp. BT-65]
MSVEIQSPQPVNFRTDPLVAAPASRPSEYLTLSAQEEAALVETARDPRNVEGLTHRHYHYPARFSPVFVGQAIDTFTDPGDLVVDPYVGGGTTLVEAYARGRNAVGSDISTLATFVSKTKLLRLSSDQAEVFLQLAGHVTNQINVHRPEPAFESWVQLGYFRNLNSSKRWRIRKAIAQAIAAIEEIADPVFEDLARCAVLRTAHWALDGRKQLPSMADFRRILEASSEGISRGAVALHEAVREHPIACPTVINRSIIGLETDAHVREAGPPRLIITSPPYPGVHVLYHRWQVDGRKESPAPFFIAKALDGSGESYYTMGGRKAHGLRTYFEQLEEALRSLAAIADDKTTLVQVVAFANPEWQLNRYLEVARNSGWQELGLSCLISEEDGRLWRIVPNRKWHATSRGQTGGAREVVLFHRLQKC